MRKLLAILLATVSLSACAGPASHGHYNYHPHYSGGWGWIAPAVIGGVIVYGATRPPYSVQPNPTNSTPVVVPKYPGVYPETPGTVWQQDWRYDQFCNCYRQFLVQVQ